MEINHALRFILINIVRDYIHAKIDNINNVDDIVEGFENKEDAKRFLIERYHQQMKQADYVLNVLNNLKIED